MESSDECSSDRAPIPLEDGSFLKDDKGSIVIPRLDDNAMRRFASQIGGRYQQARVDDADLRNLGLLESNGKLVAQDETTRLDAWQDQGYWLLLPLVLLAAFAGRRGWLFCLPLVLFVPQPASALSFDDLWLRPDQQGMRLLESSRPGEAATRFEDHRWQGYARYQAGDFAGAAEQFGKGDSAADHYNRGNALARNDELQAAIEAYEQALELDPGLDVARRNKTTVEEALRQKEAQADADPDASPPQESTSEAEQRKQPRGSKAPDTSSDSTDQTTAQAPPEPAGEMSSETLNEGPPESEPVATDQQMAQAQEVPVDPEQDQAMNQWLRKIPDDPGELLRRKFLYEQRKRQELNQ